MTIKNTSNYLGSQKLVQKFEKSFKKKVIRLPFQVVQISNLFFVTTKVNSFPIVNQVYTNSHVRVEQYILGRLKRRCLLEA